MVLNICESHIQGKYKEKEKKKKNENKNSIKFDILFFICYFTLILDFN